MNLARVSYRSKAVQYCSTDIEPSLPTPIEHDEIECESEESDEPMDDSSEDDNHNDDDDADRSFEMNSDEESSDLCTDVSDDDGYEYNLIYH